MFSQMVSWRDYDGGFNPGVTGFGPIHDPNYRNQLFKALQAGNDVSNPGAAPGVGFALRVESLEATMKNVLWRAEHIRFWRDMPKRPAFNTVEEYNVIERYGDPELGAFIAEGALPEEEDEQYDRKTIKIAYMGVTKRLTHQMMLVKPAHGNVVTQSTTAGALSLLQKVERGAWFARDDLDPLHWKGIEQQIEAGAPAANIIDLRGGQLTEEILNQGALTVMEAPNYGIATDLYLSPRAKSDLVQQFFPRARFDQFTKTNDGNVGLNVGGFEAMSGPVRFKPNVFLDDGGGNPGLAARGDSGKRPGTPTITTGATTPAAGASEFEADDAGDYVYQVVAYNESGNSAPVDVGGGAISIIAGDKMTFGVTPGAGGDVSYYKLYRSKKDEATGKERLILRVPNTAGAGELIIDDLNARLPGCTTAFLHQMDNSNLSFIQLGPMMKISVPSLELSARWAQVLYGTPVVYSPGRNVIFRNIGRPADVVGVV